MSDRVLRCAIEDLVKWHPRLLVDSHVAAFVAVTGQYSIPPAPFQVRCLDVQSTWLLHASEFTLEVSWTEETVDRAERLRATLQPNLVVELAAVAVALILAAEVLSLGYLIVTDYGDRVDYRAPQSRSLLEVSGTENLSELGRRHRAKVKQAMENPLGWDAYVVVCAFADEGHQVRVSRHEAKGAPHAAKED